MNFSSALPLPMLGLIFFCALGTARETVNFDFAWRFELDYIPSPSPHPPPGPGPPPPPHPPLPPPGPAPPARKAACEKCERGINYGTGSIAESKTATYADCCATCAGQPACKCWDWNPDSMQCYIKDNCDTSSTEDRWSGTMPTTDRKDVAMSVARAVAARPGKPGQDPAANPKHAAAFDDANWTLIDAPHDMLINQKFDARNSKGMAYLPRNSGWYRKHFTMPKDYDGKSVWLYIEGAFHNTTAFLNGQPIGSHQAAYTSFWLRMDNVTGVKYGGENVLALYCDASFGTGWWFEGGGLFRHNWLVSTDTTHLEPDGTWSYAEGITGIRELAAADAGGVGRFTADSATLKTSAEVTNHGADSSIVTVKATATDSSGVGAGTSTSASVTVPAGGTVEANSSMMITDAKIWSVQSPELYTIAVEVLAVSGTVLDAYNYTIGIRTIAYDTKGLHLNGKPVKVRGFCDHSNFAGVGGAVPDRVNLYRTQMLRSVGANAWRMAHNPPALTRLDFMDRLGMLALDENRDFGNVGVDDHEALPAQLTDMRDLIKRDRNHASVMAWSFCNEGECGTDGAEQFRQVSYEFDGTRSVTQNDDYAPAAPYLDIMGFSHKSGSVFDAYHSAHPKQPMMATECCSCMSQRGVDEDACPKPADGGCTGGIAAGLRPGDFYNNNIGKCTAQQVSASDSRETVAGTFVWSGFDYYGEARGFPQNTKCRGTVSDLAGFFKETSYWLRSWWLSNITATDYGKPPLFWTGEGVATQGTTCFIVESWQPRPAVYHEPTRSINVYTNAPGVRLLLNGRPIGSHQDVEFFGQATFSNISYAPGKLTAECVSSSGATLASHAVQTQVGGAASLVLSLDSPSAATGTGTHVVADGEDVALVRATLLDAAGNFAHNASDNVTFTVLSGPGKIWTTHNGDPANDNPRDVSWAPGYHGLVRAVVRSSVDAATPAWHRRRLLEIDIDSGRQSSTQVFGGDDAAAVAAAAGDIVLQAEVIGAPHIAPVQLTIPVSVSLAHLPANVAVV